jgi:hypothetical protein
MQVMTAPHGEGEWNPECIAASLEGFGTADVELFFWELQLGDEGQGA